jgi:hypothetical protein
MQWSPLLASYFVKVGEYNVGEYRDLSLSCGSNQDAQRVSNSYARYRASRHSVVHGGGVYAQRVGDLTDCERNHLANFPEPHVPYQGRTKLAASAGDVR